MFTPDSRYVSQPIYTVALPDGTQVTAVVPPLPNPAPLVGYHPAAGQERLDLVAVQYLNAPTGFWRLCDSNNSMVAGALAARALIGIPARGPRVSVTIQLTVGGTPVPDAFYDAIKQMEVEESSDQPGALLLRLPVNRTSARGSPVRRRRDLRADDERRAHGHPGARGSRTQCIFDGYVLSWRLHLDRASISSTIDIWAQDAVVAHEHRRPRRRMVRPDRRGGGQRDLQPLRLHARRREHR